MKKSIWIVLLLCTGCSQKAKVPVIHISVVNNSVKVTGLDRAVLAEIARDSSNEEWQSLIPVYRMPGDTDLKDYQPVQPGNYKVQDSAVVFTPDTPFAKNHTYFLRYYEYGKGSSMADFIKGQKKLGNVHYKDLIFK